MRKECPQQTLLFFLALVVPGLLLGESLRNPTWATPMELAGVENLHQVEAGLYRSGQPTAEGFKNLSALGIRTVLSLRSNHTDLELTEGTGLCLLKVPMAAWYIRDADVIAALRILKNRKSEEPLLVHCWHGADRTGLVIGAYRIICQNWTVEAAVDELQNGGFGHHIIFNNITDYLKNMKIEKIRAEVTQ
ncbi:MAG: protein-tyrosine phosphatase family protein [Lentisphaeria bacterium]